MARTVSPLIGEIDLPGDKSISHRAAMFSALAKGNSVYKNISNGEDVASTVKCLKRLGLDIEIIDSNLYVNNATDSYCSLEGKNIELDCGNSGTSLRLFTGLLSGQNITNVSLIGDDSLSRRPHDRVINPLKKLGVDIKGKDNKFTPIVMNKSNIHGETIELEVASAQVKSAILLAGLYASDAVTVIESQPTRDHTEKMLNAMGANISTEANAHNSDTVNITVRPLTKSLLPLNETIPADPSSAAFFGVAAAIIPGSEIKIQNILLNERRTAWISVLKNMGANIIIEPTGISCGEEVGNATIKYSSLKATEISGNIVASLIDELPILAIAMASAEGTSCVRDAKELRVKESDRISTVVDHLNRAGVKTLEHEDGYEIIGSKLNPVDINSDGDHRIAMSFSILNYCAGEKWMSSDESVVATSFPAFFNIFESLIVRK